MDRADDGWIKQRWASYSEEMQRGGGSMCTGLRLPIVTVWPTSAYLGPRYKLGTVAIR